MKLTIVACLIASAHASCPSDKTCPTFATDYEAYSDVSEHGHIGLDMKDIMAEIDAGNYTGAMDIYSNGKNSAKARDGNGAVTKARHLRGFSTALDGKAKKPDSDYFEMAYMLALYADLGVDFADTISSELINGGSAAKETVALSINQLNTAWYTLHEFYDGVLDAAAGAVTDNDAGVKAWDEGVAFYTGNTAKNVATHESLYGEAEAVATKFKKADGTLQSAGGIADINDALMVEFKAGRDTINSRSSALNDDQEEELLKRVDNIRGLMLASTIQWLIAARYNTDLVPSNEKTNMVKVLGTAILPELSACSTDAGKILKDNTITANNLDDEFTNIVSALQDNYLCMKVSCSIIGKYDDGSNTVPECNPANVYPDSTKKITLNGASTDISATVVGYEPASEVAPHALLDKDMLRISALMSEGDFVNAYRIYSKGWNSKKFNSDGSVKSIRNYKGFANAEKLGKFPEGTDLNKYFKSYTYLDSFITAAMKGTSLSGPTTQGFSSSTDATARKEMAGKTLQFGLNLYYVIREFYDAVDDCQAGVLTNNYGNVHAWDEGVMFWAGSLERDDGSGAGQLLHMLAEKRAGNYNYDTIPGKDASTVIADLVALFKSGKGYLNEGNCPAAEALIPEIISKMIVPVIQGIQRYAYKVGGGSSNTAKSRAEGWAFATSILPMIDACNSDEAALIVKNMDYFATVPMADGTKAVFTALQKTFECLGISCADVGELEQYGDTPPPKCYDIRAPDDSDDSPAPIRELSGLAAVTVALSAGVLMV